MGAAAGINQMGMTINQTRRDQPALQINLGPALINQRQVVMMPDPGNFFAGDGQSCIVNQAVIIARQARNPAIMINMRHAAFPFLQSYQG